MILTFTHNWLACPPEVRGSDLESVPAAQFPASRSHARTRKWLNCLTKGIWSKKLCPKKLCRRFTMAMLFTDGTIPKSKEQQSICAVMLEHS